MSVNDWTFVCLQMSGVTAVIIIVKKLVKHSRDLLRDYVELLNAIDGAITASKKYWKKWTRKKPR